MTIFFLFLSIDSVWLPSKSLTEDVYISVVNETEPNICHWRSTIASFADIKPLSVKCEKFEHGYQILQRSWMQRPTELATGCTIKDSLPVIAARWAVWILTSDYGYYRKEGFTLRCRYFRFFFCSLHLTKITIFGPFPWLIFMNAYAFFSHCFKIQGLSECNKDGVAL